jgi:hypothetical protein
LIPFRFINPSRSYALNNACQLAAVPLRTCILVTHPKPRNEQRRRQLDDLP